METRKHEQGKCYPSLPKGVSLVESKARVNNHGNPESNEDDKKQHIPAFPVSIYNPSKLATVA